MPVRRRGWLDGAEGASVLGATERSEVTSVRIEVTAAAVEADREAVLSGLFAFNRDKAGVISRPLAVFVRDEAGAVAGGLVGNTMGDWLFIELFWLPETLRGGGLGARVLLAAEAEAQARGCLGAHLDTFAFQAPGLYRKLGYEVFGAVEDHPPGHRRLWMRKRFPTPKAGTEVGGSTDG